VGLSQVGTTDRVTLSIKNGSGQAVSFARPVAGSFDGEVEPRYSVTGIEARGHELSRAPCAGEESTEDDSLVQRTEIIQPGQTFRVTFRLPPYWGTPERVRVEYSLDEKELKLAASEGGNPGRGLRSLFVGTLVSHELVLRPGRRILKHEALVIPARPSVMGALDRRSVELAVHARRDGLTRCLANKALAPGKARSFSARFVIAPTGEVKHPRVEESSLDDAALEACVAEWLGQLRFPACGCGGVILVRYPFQIYSP
jgi:hypothetical protein